MDIRVGQLPWVPDVGGSRGPTSLSKLNYRNPIGGAPRVRYLGELAVILGVPISASKVNYQNRLGEGHWVTDLRSSRGSGVSGSPPGTKFGRAGRDSGDALQLCTASSSYNLYSGDNLFRKINSARQSSGSCSALHLFVICTAVTTPPHCSLKSSSCRTLRGGMRARVHAPS
eukprot:12406330-Karenia_brevis.AAC.1